MTEKGQDLRYWGRQRVTRRRVLSGAVAGGAALGAVALIGCSSKQAYEGIQAGKRGQFEKYIEPERSKCLEATNKSYEQYERERGKEKS